jgi:hypothetical protein
VVDDQDAEGYLGELFDRLGIPYHGHFLDQLERRASPRLTERAALDAYLHGTVYYDAEQGSIIFRDSSGVIVVADPVDG